MLAKVTSAAVVGLDAVPIAVAAQGVLPFMKVGTTYQQPRLNFLCR